MRQVSSPLLIVVALVAAVAVAEIFSPGGFAQTTAPPKSQTRGLNPVKGEPIKPSGAESPPEVAATARTFALIVGISKYPNLPASFQLKYADRDAEALRAFLVSEKGGFATENVALLVNEQATRDEVYRELARLQQVSGPGSLALIFFAGHGIVDDFKQAYLLTSDSRLEELFVTSIEMGKFNGAVEGMRARSVVVISDACHSGTIGDLIGRTGPQRGGAYTNVSARAFKELSGRQDQSSFIFSAAAPTQNSLEKDSLKHGLFTHHVLEALEGKADADGNGLVTAKELYDYTLRHVREEAAREQQDQVPEYNALYDLSIPLAALNEGGRARYRQWFEDDPLVSRYVASFDDALSNKRLTKPEWDSAFAYYSELKQYRSTPPKLAKQKRDELLGALGASAESVIERAPTDPASWEEAANWLEKAFELTRDNGLRAKQYYCSAMSHYHAGEAGRAERQSDTALDFIEDNHLEDPALSVRIARFFKALDRREKARRAYQLAVEKNPTLASLNEYAEVLSQLGDLPEAEKQLRRARQLDPAHPPTLKLLAEVLLRDARKERLDEALAVAAQAHTLAPEDIDIEDVYGRALMRSGETARAVESLLKVARSRLSDEPRRDGALLHLSEALARNGEVARAVSALREAVRRGSQRLEIYDALARLLNEQGDIEGAITIAERAAQATPAEAGGGLDKAQRLRQLAEYVERTGRLRDAAFHYRDAVHFAPDAKLRTMLESHARMLFLRVGSYQDAGPMIKPPATPTDKTFDDPRARIVVPGGREALARLTGVNITDANLRRAFAHVFDACLRDAATHHRVVSFYEQYPELTRKVTGKGGGLSGSLALPPPTQTPDAAAREGLKFFGVNDKKGRRQIERKVFDARRQILEALGGDPAGIERGELVSVRLKSEELPILLGVNQWLGGIENGLKAETQEQLLAFLKDREAMKLYVGLSLIPEEAARLFLRDVLTKDNKEQAPAAIYFAAPYLRFTSQGEVSVPGQRQGGEQWQRLLDNAPSRQLLPFLFKGENGGKLYLFAALSAAGEVGDAIARSPALEGFARTLQGSALPAAREPFDLIDLFSFLRLEGGQLRLPRAVELSLQPTPPGTDQVSVLLTRLGKVSAGQSLPLVRRMAVLTHIERERPDWVATQPQVELLAKQIDARHEPQIEIALDLQLTQTQLAAYFAHVESLEAMTAPAEKRAAIRAFQSGYELLRAAAKTGSLDQERLAGATTRLLQLDPRSERFAFELLAFIHSTLGGDGDTSAGGPERENRLLARLAAGAPIALTGPKADESIDIPAGGNTQGAFGLQFDQAQAAIEQMTQALDAQRHTRLSASIDAVAALDALDHNHSDPAALGRLQTALGKFVEPEPAPTPKKKPKQPIATLPTMKELGAGLTIPVSASTLAQARARVTPFVGESLLGVVYAASESTAVAGHPDLVRKHDFTQSPWGAAEFDPALAGVRGGVARLGGALAELESRPPAASSATGAGGGARAAAALAHASQLTDGRLATARAGAYVSRSIDLGEDTLALAASGDQTAGAALGRLGEILSPRRARGIGVLLDQIKIEQAIGELTLSELYALGQIYFAARLAADLTGEVNAEPGALGAMSRIIAELPPSSSPMQGRATIPTLLKREVAQLGLPLTTRLGLARLALPTPEPYEQALALREGDRLAERMPELRLALVRACYRQGLPLTLALHPALGREAMRRTLAEMTAATGGAAPPERDWQLRHAVMQSLDQSQLRLLIDKVAAARHIGPAPEVRWDAGTPLAEQRRP